MERSQRMARINALLSRAQGVTMAQLMQELEVSRATINRDLELMRGMLKEMLGRADVPLYGLNHKIEIQSPQVPALSDQVFGAIVAGLLHEEGMELEFTPKPGDAPSTVQCLIQRIRIQPTGWTLVLQTAPDQTLEIDAQWAAIPTHPMPKALSRTVVLLPGLPAPGKDSMAGVVKPWFADAWLTHQSVVELHGFTNAEWSEAVSSAAASLSGNSWDAVFVELQGLGLCGSGGCTTQILHRSDPGWTEVGSLFGCDKIELLTTKTQGLRDIRYADCPSKQEYVYRFDGRGYVE